MKSVDTNFVTRAWFGNPPFLIYHSVMAIDFLKNIAFTAYLDN